MGLFILRLAEDGPAIKDGRIHVGDQIVEINGEPTQGITHTRAIELIQAGGNKVLLLLRPGTGLIPDHGDWDTNSPSSSNVIYDEQPPPLPSSHSASTFEESHVPATEDSLTRVQICEKAEELKDTVQEKKSTLNGSQPEMKYQSVHKTMSKKDPPRGSGHGEKSRLKGENGVTRRGRSASPKKSVNRHSEEHLEKIPRPLKSDPKEKSRDRSLSPRKGESKGRLTIKAGSGQDPNRKDRGRSSSPKKQQKIGGNSLSNTEGKLSEAGSRRAAGHPRDSTEQLPDGREKSGVSRKDLKQSQPGKTRTKSPEKKSSKVDETSLPSKKTSSTAGRVVSEKEKGKKPTAGETSRETVEHTQISAKQLKQEAQEKTALGNADDHKGRESEVTDRCRERAGCTPQSSSLVKKAPITPGPWRVPRANKVTGTTGMADKQL